MPFSGPNEACFIRWPGWRSQVRRKTLRDRNIDMKVSKVGGGADVWRREGVVTAFYGQALEPGVIGGAGEAWILTASAPRLAARK